jgi:hypothetical protein
VGVTALYQAERADDASEWLLRLDAGASFGVTRLTEDAPWGEALIEWTGRDLRLRQLRQPVRRAPEAPRRPERHGLRLVPTQEAHSGTG